MVRNIHKSIENYKDLKTTPEKVISACPERYVKDTCVFVDNACEAATDIESVLKVFHPDNQR